MTLCSLQCCHDTLLFVVLSTGDALLFAVLSTGDALLFVVLSTDEDSALNRSVVNR